MNRFTLAARGNLLGHAARSTRFARPRAARGFTLIEMLVSLAITMVMMGAVVSLFGLISDSVSGSRAIIEMSERLRSCRNRLQADLQAATASMSPPLRPESDEGYFEIIEGPDTDAAHATAAPTILGDADDVLMFTVRSRGEPFVGKYNGTATVESQTAEVMYFCARSGTEPIIDVTASPPTRLYTLYRRVLLVSPGLINSGTFPAATPTFYNDNDISVRYQETPPLLIPNSLGDLTKRENRFAHLGTAWAPVFPFNVSTSKPSVGAFPTSTHPDSNAWLASMSGARFADDILMTNVLSFDVQVYDPNAALRSPSGGSTPLVPSDSGYAAGTNLAVSGAYVNLGSSYTAPAGLTPQFNQTDGWRAVTGTTYLVPTALPAATTGTAYTYDTWSLHYENNGINEDNDTATDEGTDGLDNDANGVVDDPGEAETQAPFATPLRGIRVTIRAYEPSSRQVRQVVVVQDFLPE